MIEVLAQATDQVTQTAAQPGGITVHTRWT